MGEPKWCSNRKRQGPMGEKCCYNEIIMIFSGEKKTKTKEDKRMVKLEFLSKLPFLDIYQKKSTRSFFGAWSFLLVHIHFTPSEGPEGFVNFFLLRNRTMKVGPSSRNKKKGHLPWSDFMVYGVNQP